MTTEQIECMELQPMLKWSTKNQSIVRAAQCNDARGFQQWKRAGRQVKKGARAIYIWLPCHSKDKDTDIVKTYFKKCPVFRIEDTESI